MSGVDCENAAARLGHLVRGLVPPGVAVATLDPRLDHAGLLPEERPAVAGAIERRRREFTAGRVAARRAMAELGVPGTPVPSGEDRAPVWPPGIVGSISHGGDCCVAVVARSDLVRSIGIDVEPDEPLDSELIASICTPAEAAWLETRPAGERGRLAKLIFSAKESAYKCRYALTHTPLEFHDIAIGLGRDTFSASFSARFGEEDRLDGKFVRALGLVVTLVVRRAG